MPPSSDPRLLESLRNAIHDGNGDAVKRLLDEGKEGMPEEAVSVETLLHACLINNEDISLERIVAQWYHQSSFAAPSTGSEMVSLLDHRPNTLTPGHTLFDLNSETYAADEKPVDLNVSYLQIAIQKSHSALMAFFVLHGGVPQGKDKYGWHTKLGHDNIFHTIAKYGSEAEWLEPRTASDGTLLPSLWEALCSQLNPSLVAGMLNHHNQFGREYTPLHIAILLGKTALVKAFLKRGAQPDVLYNSEFIRDLHSTEQRFIPRPNPETPFLSAVQMGHFATALVLSEVTDKNGNNLFLQTVRNATKETLAETKALMTILLKQGVSLEYRNAAEEDVWAVISQGKRSFELYKPILEHYPLLLQNAMDAGDIDKVTDMLYAGVPADLVDYPVLYTKQDLFPSAWLDSIVAIVCLRTANTVAIKNLFLSGTLTRPFDKATESTPIDNEIKHTTPLLRGLNVTKILIEHIEAGRTQIVRYLLDFAPECISTSCLTVAARAGHLPILRLLLARGANPNDKVSFPLSAAAQTGNLEAAKLLLEHGADIHAIHQKGGTALMQAICAKQTDMVFFLIEKGASLDIPLPNGQPLLHLAVQYDQARLTKHLLLKQHDIHATWHISSKVNGRRSTYDWTILNTAIHYKAEACMPLLLGYHTNPEFQRAANFARTQQSQQQHIRQPEPEPAGFEPRNKLV